MRMCSYSDRDLRLRWIDCAVTLVAVLAVRLMVRGIPFAP